MQMELTANTWDGAIRVPSSKSMGHRHLICAALSRGTSTVQGVSPSQDIEATLRILQALGVRIHTDTDGTHCTYTVTGGMRSFADTVLCDAGESGSTLRFLLPLAVWSGNTTRFIGRGRLPERPLQPYYSIFQAQHIAFHRENGSLPLTVHGVFHPGTYVLPGNMSSQFFSGLLFMLPLLRGNSELRSTTPIESAGYLALTLDCLAAHGIEVQRQAEDGYFIRGEQSYRAGSYTVEGDYSQAAFWLAAGTLQGRVVCKGLQPRSRQGDKAIISLLQAMGANLHVVGDTVRAETSSLHGIAADVADCPDLVPVLAALATQAQGVTYLYHAARVRLKECDRLHAMTVELQKLGAHIEETPDSLRIVGKTSLRGGRVCAWRDHRIAMALAVLAASCEAPLQLEGAEAVQKSYPQFWQDFQTLGGSCRQEA